MKTHLITEPNWDHVLERDRRIRLLAALMRKVARKGIAGVVTRKDFDRLESSARRAEREIGSPELFHPEE